MKRIDWFVIVLIVVAFWILDVWIVPLIDHFASNEYCTAVYFGICIGQINLIGAWGALTPGKVIVRLPWAVFLGTLMWQAITIGMRYVGGITPEDRLVLGIAILFGVVVAQVPLWVARGLFRWRLLPPGFLIENVAAADAQFNLKHLFLGTFVTSLALAVARFMLGDFNFRNFSLEPELLVLVPVVAICNSIVTAPCIWMAFCKWGRLGAWAASWLLYVVVVSAAELIVLTPILGPPGGSASVLVFTCLNLAQCVTVLATLLLLRGIRFKLVRAK